MRPWLVLMVVGTAVGLATPPLARADEAGAKKTDKAAKEGKEEHKDAEHKDDVFKGVLDLAIWTVVVFLVLLFVLRRFAWKPLLEGLDKREQSIVSAMEEAQAARAEAQKLRAEFEAERARANDEARQIRDQARLAAEHIAQETMAQGKAELQAERQRLHHEVETMKDQALQHTLAHVAQVASLIATKALGREVTLDDHRRLVDEALDEFRLAAQERRQEYESVRA
jgi:F-type H+-transporting ATPase subunit b